MKIPTESEEGETKKQKKKSRSGHTSIRRIIQEPNKNQQHLSIQATGSNQPNTPIRSDLVSDISLPNMSEQSEICAIEVPIGSATTTAKEDDEPMDQTMAANKRSRPKSPETKKKKRPTQKRGRRRKTE